MTAAARGAVRRALALGLVAAAATGLAACGGGGGRTASTGRTTANPDYFVGEGDGVGASVDFGAEDAVTRVLRPALARGPRPAAVAVASILNSTSRAAPAPVFAGVLADGSTVPLTSAWLVLGGRDDPAARRARGLLPEPGPLAPDATTAIYLTLSGRRPADLAGVRMRTAGGSVTNLEPQTR